MTVRSFTVAIALVALRAVALAHPADVDSADVEDDSPAFNMFGFRLTAGALPLDGDRATVMSLGLGVEHPVFGKTRVFGEYEWLWVSWLNERAMDSVAMRPERHGTGHRVWTGVRRELIAKGVGRNVRLFVDGELGGGVALVDDNTRGVALVPAGVGGLRLGYDIYSGVDDSPSRTFELELLVRAVVIGDGAGALVGIGMLWGN